jgi:heme exporter protein B
LDRRRVAARRRRVHPRFPYGHEPSGYDALVAAMALGAPSLSLIGAIGAALTLGARRGGIPIPLLVLPLYIPVLILGAGALESTISGLGARRHLLILGAIAMTALPLAAVSAAAAVRQSLE